MKHSRTKKPKTKEVIKKRGAYLSSVINLSGGDLDEALDTVLLGGSRGNASDLDEMLLVDLQEGKVRRNEQKWEARSERWLATKP